MKQAGALLPPIFRSQAQARLLAEILLFTDPEEGASLTALQRSTGLAAGTVHKEVERLEAAGLVRSERVGRTRLVSADPSSPLYEDLHSLLLKIYGPIALLRDALSEAEGIEAAVVFGSWARRRGGEKGPPPRDVDVLVVGAPDLDAVYQACREVEEQIGLPVNPTVLSREEWEEADRGFVRAVRRGPSIPVIGELG